MKSNECFYCKHHDRENAVLAEDNGWYHSCIKGIKNEGLKNIKECPGYYPCNGFQIGGYYSHMYFEADGVNECMEWVIESDGAFPTKDKKDFIRFHICDFEQIERFVKKWGDYLREKGYITGDE